MNIFKKLFGPKETVFDQLFELTNPQYFQFWNGVNHYGEMMWSKDPNDPQTLLHKETYSYENEDYPDFFKLSLGNYWSHCGDATFQYHMIEIYVNEDMTIRHVSTSGYYGKAHDCFSCKPEHVKKVGRLIEKLKVEGVLKTRNSKITDFLSAYILADKRFKHEIPVSIDCFGDLHFKLAYDNLKGGEKAYKERHPKYEVRIDADYLAANPTICWVVPQYNTEDEADARRAEAVKNMRIPSESIHVRANCNW